MGGNAANPSSFSSSIAFNQNTGTFQTNLQQNVQGGAAINLQNQAAPAGTTAAPLTTIPIRTTAQTFAPTPATPRAPAPAAPAAPYSSCCSTSHCCSRGSQSCSHSHPCQACSSCCCPSSSCSCSCQNCPCSSPSSCCSSQTCSTCQHLLCVPAIWSEQCSAETRDQSAYSSQPQCLHNPGSPDQSSSSTSCQTSCSSPTSSCQTCSSPCQTRCSSSSQTSCSSSSQTRCSSPSESSSSTTSCCSPESHSSPTTSDHPVSAQTSPDPAQTSSPVHPSATVWIPASLTIWPAETQAIHRLR